MGSGPGDPGGPRRIDHSVSMETDGREEAHDVPDRRHQGYSLGLSYRRNKRKTDLHHPWV